MSTMAALQQLEIENCIQTWYKGISLKKVNCKKKNKMGKRRNNYDIHCKLYTKL